MAYADALRQAVFSTETCADLIDGVQIYADSSSMYSGASANSTSSSTSSLMPGSNIAITVASGESVVLFWTFSYSVSAAGIIIWKTYRDTSALNAAAVYLDTGASTGTTGYQAQASCMEVNTPGAGTFTYSLYWSTTAGTLYSRFGNVFAFKIKRA